MSTNSTQAGEVLTLTAPLGGVVSGGAYLIGSLLVIATVTASAGDPFEAQVKGVVNVPKVGDEVWTENQKIYFDESEGKFTTDDDGTANQLVGVAVEPIAARVLVETDAEDGISIDPDTNVITITDYTALAGKSVTVTVGGTTTTVTEAESGDWEAATSDEDTAASLAAALDAIDGISADDDGADVDITPGTGASSASPFVGSVRLDGVAR